MEKPNSVFLLGAVCLFFLSGCAGVFIERSVQDNLFISSSAPKIAIRINPDLKYMGKFEVTNSIATTFGQFEGRKVPVKYISYLFCDIGDNQKIRKMCSINFSEILDQNSVHPDAPLKGAEDDISPGVLRTAKDTDRHLFKIVDNPLSHGMNKFIYDAGFTNDFLTAGCYLFKTVKRNISEDSKILMSVDYAEDVENGVTCHEWNKPFGQPLTEKHQKRVNEFLHNSNENIQILTNG